MDREILLILVMATVSTATGDDVVCGEITLTHDGVLSDPLGRADVSTLESTGDWYRWVEIDKFTEITNLTLVEAVGGNCKNPTKNNIAVIPYGVRNGGIFIDGSCQAVLKVCGKPPRSTTEAEVCSPITLTKKGVAFDPNGVADPSTLVHKGQWMWVRLKFTEITDVQFVKAVAGSSCSGLRWRGTPSPGYGVVHSRNKGYTGGIFTDLGCQAELRVCGKRFGIYSTGHGKKTYFQAATACKDRGMTLAMAKTAEEIAQLDKHFNELLPAVEGGSKRKKRGVLVPGLGGLIWKWKKKKEDEERLKKKNKNKKGPRKCTRKWRLGCRLNKPGIFQGQVIPALKPWNTPKNQNRRGWLGLEDISGQGFMKWIDGSHVHAKPFPLKDTSKHQYGCFAVEAVRNPWTGVVERKLASTNCDLKLPYICGHQATWTEWSYPDACSVSCGVGVMRRARECKIEGMGTVADFECGGESTWELPCTMSCEAKPITQIKGTTCPVGVPGVLWTYRGYDITQLDLLPWDQTTSGPGGMKGQVLSVTCDNPGVLRFKGGRYNVSDQIRSVTPIPSGGCNEHSVEFNSTNEVSDKFSENVGFEASYLSLFSFSASASYQKMSKTVKNKKKFFSEISCYYLHLKVNLNLKNFLQLHPQAQSIVDRIKEPWNPKAKAYIHQPQYELIDNFGTHYFSDAILGGKYQLTNEVDSSFLHNHDKKDVDEAMKADAEIGSFKAGINANRSTEDEATYKEFQKKSNKYEQYFGGNIDLQTKGRREKWQDSTYEEPWILSGHVKPIYDLIHNEVKKLWVMQAVEQYVLRRFVDNAAELNEPYNPKVESMIDRLSDKMLTVAEVKRLRNLLVS